MAVLNQTDRRLVPAWAASVAFALLAGFALLDRAAPGEASPGSALPRDALLGPKDVFADAETVNAVALIAHVDRSGPRRQCAIYARERTGLDLRGAARSWWAQADGRYRRSHAPEPGAVIVMGGTRAGHVGVVSAVLDERNILIDHANWLNAGEIVTGALVRDVSEANDWSVVRVWHPPTRTLGVSRYPVYGFVHADPADDPGTDAEQVSASAS
jgi:surface antigen